MFEILHVGRKLTYNMYNIIYTIASGHFIVNFHILSSIEALIFLLCRYFHSLDSRTTKFLGYLKWTNVPTFCCTIFVPSLFYFFAVCIIMFLLLSFI